MRRLLGGGVGGVWPATREQCDGCHKTPKCSTAAKRAGPCEALTMLRRPQLLTISLICVKMPPKEVGEADQQDPLNNRYHRDQSFSRYPTETTPIPLLRPGFRTENKTGYGTVRFIWKSANVLPMTAEQKKGGWTGHCKAIIETRLQE